MSDKKFVISIAEATDDEESDVGISTWIIGESTAMGYRLALTEAHGEPMSGILSKDAMNEIDRSPGVILLDHGDQPSQELQGL